MPQPPELSLVAASSRGAPEDDAPPAPGTDASPVLPASSLPLDAASPALQLAHPNWLVYPQIEQIARKLSVSAQHAKRSKIQFSVRPVWRAPAGPNFDRQIKLETANDQFFVELVNQGCAPEAAKCLKFLSQMGRPGITAEEFNLARARLGTAANELKKGLKFGAIAPPKGWDVIERQARISAVKFDPPVLASPDELRTVQALGVARAQAEDRQAKALVREARLAATRDEVAAHRRALHDIFQALRTEQGELPGELSLSTYLMLQAPTVARQFKAAYGEVPSPLGLQRLWSLTPDAFRVLNDYQTGVDKALHEQAEAKRDWERSLVAAVEVPDLLYITHAEYDKWVADGRLAVAERKTVRKGGKDHLHVMHDPVELQRLSPTQIEVFRTEDHEGMPAHARQAWMRGIDKLRAKQAMGLAIAAIPALHGCRAVPPTPTRLGWVKDATLKVPVSAQGAVALWPAVVRMEASVVFPSNRLEIDALADKVGNAFSSAVQAEIVRKLSHGVDTLLAEYATSLTRDQSKKLCDALKSTLNSGLKQSELSGGVIQHLLDGPAGALIKRIEETRAQDLLKLKDYPQAFGMARSLGRRVHFKLGPTNSGKTHEALEALKNAHSGLYLAPLRLLAMEIRDRLTAFGVPCNLLTGEEHDLVPGARHTACTVEMMDPTREVEVAVLDEIQMLLDEQRGWAWTSALVGAPARDVYVCGANSVHKACVRVLDSLGEQHDTTYLARKTPLEVEATPLSPSKGKKFAAKGLQRGDAVIAFSRKDVLTLSARYREHGYSVSTIYGALAPEVRRTESERFASGESDIVVATDAIGMGLNLPVRRVVFSTVHKFDGEAVRPLNPTELRQIAGRAGRFGMHPKGLVAALDGADLPHIRKMLEVTVPNREMLLPIAPSLWHIEALAQLLGTTKMGEVLTFFTTRIAAESSLFETASLEDTIALAHVVDQMAPDLSLQDKFSFSCAPVSIEKDTEFRYFETCLKAYVAQRRLKLPNAGVCLDDDAGRNLQEAEHLSKDLSLYAWLSFKFPETFVEFGALPALRTRVSRYIEKGLLLQDGFGMTSKESFEGRRGARGLLHPRKPA